jgi:hypothetical protein
MPLSLQTLDGWRDFWNAFLNFAKAEIQTESRFDNWRKNRATKKLWPYFDCLVRLEVDLPACRTGFACRV